MIKQTSHVKHRGMQKEKPQQRDFAGMISRKTTGGSECLNLTLNSVADICSVRSMVMLTLFVHISPFPSLH